MQRKKILRYMHGIHLDDRFEKSDQRKNIPLPPSEKESGTDQIIKLSNPLKIKTVRKSVTECILERKSVRLFTSQSITIDELSYLLWASQGIKKHGHDKRHAHHAIKRTVPSAGSRHPFETYLIINNVRGLKKGIYRYIASLNSLVWVNKDPVSQEILKEVMCRQAFCAKAPVLFIWTAIPYRTEWRYGTKRSLKVILIDIGHVGQNLHIACEALNLGTCMIGAYLQESLDNLIGVDGVEEFSIYVAPVGRKKE